MHTLTTVADHALKAWRYAYAAIARSALAAARRAERLRVHVRGRFAALPPPGRVAVMTVLAVLLGAFIFSAAVLAVTLHYVYFDRANMPDIEALVRFDCPTIGHLYDEQGASLVELSTEHRRIVRYDELPPVVRDAILAAEDKNFFSHGGVDYSGISRVVEKIRFGALLSRVARPGRTLRTTRTVSTSTRRRG